MSSFTEQILHLPALWVYLIVGLLVFSEAAIFVGFVLPGETAVLLGGVTAALGHVSLPVLLALVVLSAIIGDSMGFEVGRRYGKRVVNSRLLRKHQARLADAEQFLRKRGGGAVFLARFTAFLRAVMPALSGTSGMRYPTFLLFNVTGGVIWGTGVVLLGFYAGHSYPVVEKALGGTSTVIIAVLVLAGLLVWHHRRHRAVTKSPL
ncbi:MAG: DedA family protein [Ornithinimicrobium sp.]